MLVNIYVSNAVEPGFALGRRFELERRLGQGVTGEVWQARDTQEGDRRVAIKIFDSEYTEVLRYWERFEREAAVLQRLEHPGLVRLFSFNRFEKRAYLVMELVDGIPLHTYLRGETDPNVPLDMMQAVNLFGGAAEALAYAHGQGIIHRDIKPENLLVEGREPPRVRLVDFGFAKLLTDESGQSTTVGRIFGTPAYMAPEQFQKKPTVPQTDIFALGCVLFELLTKRRMFIRDQDNHPSMRSEDFQAPWNRPERVMRRILSEPHPDVREYRSDVSDALCEVIKKAMSIVPNERFSGPDTMLAAARAAIAEEPIDRVPSIPTQPSPIEQTDSLSKAAALLHASEPPTVATEVIRDGLKQKAGSEDVTPKAFESVPESDAEDWDLEGATVEAGPPTDVDLTRVNPQPLSAPKPTVISMDETIPSDPAMKTVQPNPTLLVPEPHVSTSLGQRPERFIPLMGLAFVIVFSIGWVTSRMLLDTSELLYTSGNERFAPYVNTAPSTNEDTAPNVNPKAAPTVTGRAPGVKPKASEPPPEKPGRNRASRNRAPARAAPEQAPPPQVAKSSSFTPKLDALLARAKANPGDGSLASELSDRILARARKLPETQTKKTIIRQATTSGMSGDINGLEESLARLRKALAKPGA